MSKNYTITKNNLLSNIGEKGREMFGETLGLTGCEISMNSMPAGEFVPFVHSHKMNEEVYIILGGKGKLKIDDEEIEIEKGNVIKISPHGKRALKALESDLIFLCIQTQKNSLTQATNDDGVMEETKASWM